ncbi:hypothetical protein BU25DRAFT_211885 [Macroventuria anomochaeta]|uniref:Uncharacterized protein n=1 Tax=Macroventuria anomochaeta TaxID=301207 RepID=A0ACB6RK98_9PLEO|nr:uncharacterized protein BU25DRAFT_211885 [Macroventuria anomochaeta]KAF2622385.1 hypothetical protein BU25DRAFT_211885 [Macroventuria anomochaeta]
MKSRYAGRLPRTYRILAHQIALWLFWHCSRTSVTLPLVVDAAVWRSVSCNFQLNSKILPFSNSNNSGYTASASGKASTSCKSPRHLRDFSGRLHCLPIFTMRQSHVLMTSLDKVIRSAQIAGNKTASTPPQITIRPEALHVVTSMQRREVSLKSILPG